MENFVQENWEKKKDLFLCQTRRALLRKLDFIRRWNIIPVGMYIFHKSLKFCTCKKKKEIQAGGTK